MSLSAALRDRLRAASVADGSIYRDERPDTAKLPAVVLLIVSDPQPSGYEGRQKLREARVQLDCIGNDRSEADAIAESAINALEGAGTISGVTFQRSFVGDVRRRIDATSQEKSIFTTSPELYVWHHPAV